MILLEVSFENLHSILRSLYTDMMPLCGNMAGVAKGMAGLGALFYVAHRVWQSLSRAEPIDVYPLLRPFVIGLCIMFFPTFVLGTINSVMSPVVKGCNSMLQSQTFDMKKYSDMKAQVEHDAMMRNPETAWLVDNDTFDKELSELGITDAPKIAGMYIERSMYNLKKQIRDWFRELLEIMFQAASLVVDTIRTFYLIVLAILGPIAFAISVYDGFSSTLTQWISRYISIYLWLPVSDLFSSIIAQIQIKILQNDIVNIQSGTSAVLDSSNTIYIIFLLIGIVGYFTIPTVASWIISAGGMGAYGKNITSAAGWAGARAGAVSGAISGNIAGRLVNREEKS